MWPGLVANSNGSRTTCTTNLINALPKAVWAVLGCTQHLPAQGKVCNLPQPWPTLIDCDYGRLLPSQILRCQVAHKKCQVFIPSVEILYARGKHTSKGDIWLPHAWNHGNSRKTNMGLCHWSITVFEAVLVFRYFLPHHIYILPSVSGKTLQKQTKNKQIQMC